MEVTLLKQVATCGGLIPRSHANVLLDITQPTWTNQWPQWLRNMRGTQHLQELLWTADPAQQDSTAGSAQTRLDQGTREIQVVQLDSKSVSVHSTSTALDHPLVGDLVPLSPSLVMQWDVQNWPLLSPSVLKGSNQKPQSVSPVMTVNS